LPTFKNLPCFTWRFGKFNTTVIRCGYRLMLHSI